MDGEAWEDEGRKRRGWVDHGDYCSESGAKALKEKIEGYWRERGYAVQVHLFEQAFTQAMRTTRFDLRSDMRGGFPTKKIQQIA